MNKFSVIIPARSGSKRVKDKNLLLFKNKTLIENTFIQSKKIQIYLKNIILSSDSQNYLDILKKNELLIKDLRPKKYAHDSTKTEDLIYYLLEASYIQLDQSVIMDLGCKNETTLPIVDGSCCFLDRNTSWI